MTTTTPKPLAVDLIARLEAPPEGSRVLDQEIFHALDLCPKVSDGTCCDYRAPDYTTSLDAALTLVPDQAADEAVFWRVGNDGEGGNPADFKAEIYVTSLLVGKQFNGTAATPALALAIAALKARETTNG
jgi:hypothetical protein